MFVNKLDRIFVRKMAIHKDSISLPSSCEYRCMICSDEMAMQCRTCLTTKADTFIRMDSPVVDGINFYSCFGLCTQLEATPDDELPGVLCASCAQDLQDAFNFMQNARQADAILRESLAAKLNQQELVLVQEEELVEDDCRTMERLELTEVSEGEECVVEEFIDDDGEGECDDDTLPQMEIMEVEAVEEIEDPLEELTYVDEKPLQLAVPSDVAEQSTQNSCTTYQSQHDSEFYAEDEADDAYLIEYTEDEAPHEPSVGSNGAKWKCIDCKRILHGDVSYEGHMNMHRDLRPYKCPQCLCAFRCRNALERHAEMRHRRTTVTNVPDSLSCTQCNKPFATPATLEEHYDLVHPSSYPAQCASCPLVPPLARAKYAEHFRVEHPDVYGKYFPLVVVPSQSQSVLVTPWHCDVCQRYMHTEAALVEHRETHLSGRPYECQSCGKRFATSSNLWRHMRGMHPLEYEKVASDGGDTVEQCEICKKQLLRRNFEKHMALHEKKEREATEVPTKFLCAYCSQEFSKAKNVALHEQNVHLLKRDEPKYECGICQRKCFQQRHLATHMQRVHIAERKHVCDICGNAFKSAAQLMAHKLLHEKKSHQCPHCHKKYTRQADLNVHLRSHTGELPYACHLCDKRFAIRVRLTYHLQKHQGVKHQCPHCGIVYDYRNQLKEHLFKHTGMPYRCELCATSVGFTRRLRFANHMQRVHNQHISEDELAAIFAKYTGKAVHFNAKVLLPTNDADDSQTFHEFNVDKTDQSAENYS